MRTFYIRRKDLDHVPFQYYISKEGVEQRLEEGYTGVFTISPSRGDIDTVYVRVVEDLAREITERWALSRGDLIRVAAKGAELWVKNAVPADHLYGPEWLKMDQDWCPRDPNGGPAMMANPYTFEVVTDEPWPSILDWDFNQPRHETAPVQSNGVNPRRIVFGFTLDVFPATLILGYEQIKHRAADAGLDCRIEMLPLNELPQKVDVLFVPKELEQEARQLVGEQVLQPLTDLVNDPAYDRVLKWLKEDKAAISKAQ